MYILVLALLTFALSTNYVSVATNQIRLEHAVLKYFNPEYVENPGIFTYRAKRGEPYVTNATITTKHQWNNNVSAALYYKVGRVDEAHELFRIGHCDMLKVGWMMSLIKKYSDIPHVCPFPARAYHLRNFMLNKNFPVAIPGGKSYLNYKYEITSSRKLLLDFEATIFVF